MRRDLAAGPVTPTWCSKVLAPYGKNPLGEPIYRIVFSSRRVSVLGGYWEESGAFRYAIRPRYPKRNCWVLEKWIHARHYGDPARWAEQTVTPDGHLAIGPYPLRGIYECCYLFQFTPLRPDTVLDVVRSIFISRCRTVADIRRDLADQVRESDAAQDAAFEQRWDDTHGVRRGLSYNSEGVLTDTDDISKYLERLVTAPKVRRDNFRSGFSQGEINVKES